MKKTTFLGKFQLVLVLITFFTFTLFAGNIVVDENGSNSLTVKENTYTQLGINSKVSDVGFQNIKTKGGNFILLSIDGYNYSIGIGDPKLPVIKKLIEVPVDATFEINVISQEYVDLKLADFGITDFVLPAQAPMSKSIENPEDVEFIYNQAAYQIDGFQGQELVKVTNLGVMRGVRIARLEIAPLLYNPVQNMIRVYKNVEVKINFTGGDIPTTLQNKEQLFSPYYEGVFSELINYKSTDSKELIMDEPVTYVIVSDAMFQSALQPFVEWKTKKGYYVIEGYTNDPGVGNTTTSIKNYLSGLYNNPPSGYNAPTFVLLVGDVAQIPAYNGTSGGHVTDLYYMEYTGDIFPEVLYGRFSANNLTQLQPQIDKTLEYEQYAFPDPTFLDEVVMVAGADASHQTWSNGQINYGTTYYFNEAHGLYSYTYLQPEPGGGNYAANIHQNVSDGVSYANYTAHCSALGWADPSFNLGDIAALANAHKYCLMVGNCCQSVEFQTTCFGEEIVRAANKGALGYIGGSNSTYWDEDYYWGVGAKSVTLNPLYDATHLGSYDRTFHDHGEPLAEWYATQGQMIPAGNLAVSQSTSTMETYYWEIYHLMGDPSVMIYYSQAPEMTASYQGLMPLATTSFTVNTDPYAYVAISKDGVLHGCAVADNTGLAEVTLYDPIVVPGIADVVITGQNLQPFIGTVNVASPSGAYVLLNNFTIDDSNGNNNGMVDFDENIHLDITLENMGSQLATNVVGTLSTTDEYITLNTFTHNWPNIAAGSTSAQSDAFIFTVDELITDQHVAHFDLSITDGSETWTSGFNITLNAPVLSILSYVIDDATGNNNGRLDPGETIDIIVPNMNEGGSDALNAVANAISTDPFLTVNNASYNIGLIAAGATMDAIFNITASQAAPVGQVANVNYSVSSGVYMANTVLAITVGLIVEDFETGDFSSYDWDFSGNADWIINNQTPYEGVYCAASGDIADGQLSAIFVAAEVATPSEISFWYKVSSESGYDYLSFYIDGTMQNQWSGEVSWTEASYPVSAGAHTFKWEYSKDYSVSSGSDCAFVDFIVFPPLGGIAPLSVMVTATPSQICAGESSQLMAYAVGGSGVYTYSWMPTTGLNNPNIANPIASPETTTTYYVVVDDGESTVTDNKTLNVDPVPETPTIAQQSNMMVSSAPTGNQWYNSAGLIPGAVNQTYEPTATDDYYVIVTNVYGCESEMSNVYHFVYTGVIDIVQGQSFVIYPNPFNDNFTLDFSLKADSKVKISIYNLFGQEITTMRNESAYASGNHRVNFFAEGLLSGVYYCKIETSEYSFVQRIIHSK
jgi:hypothetical protein